MKYIARSGTPSHLEEKVYDTASPCKKHLRKRIMHYIEWADRYATDLAGELRTISYEADEIDMILLPVEDPRGWRAQDDHTGVEFVFQLEKRYG